MDFALNQTVKGYFLNNNSVKTDFVPITTIQSRFDGSYITVQTFTVLDRLWWLESS